MLKRYSTAGDEGADSRAEMSRVEGPGHSDDVFTTIADDSAATNVALDDPEAAVPGT